MFEDEYIEQPKVESFSDPDSFYESNKGDYVDADEYQEYAGPTKHKEEIKSVAKQFSTFDSNEEFNRSMSYILTLASLDVAAPDANEVVLFVENHQDRLRRVSPRMHSGRKRESKPEIVAFLVPHADAEKNLQKIRDKEAISVPTTNELVAAARLKLGSIRSSQCMRHLFALSRHRPASSLQYGIISNTSCFWLLAVGRDAQISWPVLRWVGDDNEVSDATIRKLYACVMHIQDEALRNRRREHPSVPKLLYTKENALAAVGVYSAEVGKKRFNLLPIFTGKGNGRKPFVAIAAAEGNPNDLTIFKYSWHEPILHLRERGFLERLRGAPGVVRIDEALCVNSIQEDWAPEYGSFSEHDATVARKRSLLALKTIGHPLSSCSSVLEFLEAMYDLLEVLRYLVEEEGVLHRDVSWGNVLIRPQPGDNVRGKFVSERPPDGVEHHYRFISDIYNEKELKVRVALADFDHAFDLKAVNDDLKGVVGTPMFMANDVLRPHRIESGLIKFGAGPCICSDIEQAAQAVASHNQKYHDAGEKEFWDEFYLEKLKDLKWVDTEFTHGAVHDAESVFCICLLFFSRMWPQGKTIKASELYQLEKGRGGVFSELAGKRAGVARSRAFAGGGLPTAGFDEMFYNMLKTIRDYLSQTWYNVASTGRGEAYEFHLHDFMQRLLLKEILALRKKDIPLDTYPLQVSSWDISPGYPFTSCYKLMTTNGGIAAQKRGRDEPEDSDLEPRAKRWKGSNSPHDQTEVPMSSAGPVGGLEHPGEQPYGSGPTIVKPTPSLEKIFSTRDDVKFCQEAWDLLHEKKAEVLWFKCDRRSLILFW